MRSTRCRGCYQNTALHTACTVHRTVIGGVTVERWRYSPLDAILMNSPLRCPGCNTIAGGYHHLGCPDEPCPRCGRIGPNCRCSRITPPNRPTVFADGHVPDEPREIEFARE
jgi:hypothetical protein